MVCIVTPRLQIVAAEPLILRAEAEAVQGWCAPLGVRQPATWPPPPVDAGDLRWLAAESERHPGDLGWYAWYAVRREPRALVGCAGFKGGPDRHGSVEIGYALLEPCRGRGLGTELVQGLVKWAFEHPEVSRVMAITFPELVPSVRVLEKNGFTPVGRCGLPGALRFELRRAVHDGRVARRSDRS